METAMGYATILASLASEAHAPATLAAAAMLARSGNAHLTGLYVTPAMRLYVASPYGDVDVTARLLEQHRKFHEDECGKVRALFEKTVDGETFGHAWRNADSPHIDPLETIMQHARACGLVVAHNPARDDDGERLGERLVMECGRPVLLVPAGDAPQTLGRDVTVAWNGTRESARAMFDALPLLREAEMVHLLWVDPPVGPSEDASRAADSVAASLAHAGVTCEAVVASAQKAVGDEILGRVADYGSDLLVMGGYGHSRFRQLVFGGVTRQVLSDMPVPVLMSH
jgi:nucleotide-binding universal stress UspA family protein